MVKTPFSWCQANPAQTSWYRYRQTLYTPNRRRHPADQFHLEDIKTLPLDGSAILLDTRTPEEYERGHVAGFTNIPVDVLREHLKELPKEKPVYVMCQSGLRSYIATRILEGNGYRAYNFSGGFRFYDAVMNDRCLIASAAACGMDQA